MTGRDIMLQRIRQAVHSGNQAGVAADLPQRGSVGYQGAAPDPVARFAVECSAAGGTVYVVPDREGAVGKLLELVGHRNARRLLLGSGAVIDPLDLAARLSAGGCEVLNSESLRKSPNRDAWFAADASITGVDYLIAETGSLVILTKPDEPRSLSLLPPVHIVMADRSQLLPDLFDLFDLLGQTGNGFDFALPSCISIITGPSKTGDIELKLVTGVHGPGEVHVILISG